jgi:NTE family protein
MGPKESKSATYQADLVLEGGGVRGIGLAGAVNVLAEHGYRFQRVAGTSAGAITGALVAAMEAAEEPVTRLRDIVKSMDYAKFADRGVIGRHAGPLRPVADAFAVLLRNGISRGDYLREWLTRTLADRGIRTFGDLRLPPDQEGDLPETHQYRLVVMASDVSRQRLVRLPWDYPDYGLDPDEQSVADAVRMSASLPFYFVPTTLPANHGKPSTLVDGGLHSSYPITVFDRTDGKPPRWPTIGVKLSIRERPPSGPVRGPLSLALATLDTMIGSWDEMQIAEHCNRVRSVFVDATGFSLTNFDLSEQDQDALYRSGEHGAEEFLKTWDFASYIKACRGGAQ